MEFTQLISLAGGLALFLYGMHMMSSGLEQTAGDRLKIILEKLTKNPFLGVLTGSIITAVIQSSSATTVMVVGFVNAKLMSIYNAVWVIMGANIGTTITGQLVALNIGQVAPVLALSGVIMALFAKRKNLRYIGEIIAGLGILFIGMNLMSGAMAPLRENEQFISVMTRFKNPILGILGGAAFTAVIQSSSASVGILQALALSGAIGFDSCIFILFGQNIGTCVTALLASLDADINAKRAMLIHLMFNVFGTVIFTLLFILFPKLTNVIAGITPDSVVSQIANTHTIFNVVTTLMFFPFGRRLADLSTYILPDNKKEKGKFLNNVTIGASAIGVAQLRSEIENMYRLAVLNTNKAFEQVFDYDFHRQKEIVSTEDDIDLINAQIADKIVAISVRDISYRERNVMAKMMKIISDIERIADHALNLAEYGDIIKKDKLDIESQRIEIDTLYKLITDSMSNLTDLAFVESNESQIDSLRVKYQQNQFERIQSTQAGAKLSVIYDEILTDIERISDHLLNLSQQSALLA